MTNLHEQLVKINAEITNHCSDLYVRLTPEVLKLVQASGRKFSFFENQVESGVWIDVTFAYEPYWAEKQAK